ncbi:MAG TPA: hypothetical protein VLI90_01005, partial [Tepidisphaeraceae bacterium]|nr:hypothetical protein [Tepidisphaeraceae bacterium]
LESPPLMALTAGQAAVQFVGRPVELTPVGSTVHAAVVTYRNDGAVRLENSPALPIVEMRQDRGMMFDAESIQYDPATQLATILGRSDARMPTARGAQELTASWTRRGVLHFTGNPAQPDAVDRADLDGHVSVEHPSFNLKSNQLALDMEKIAVPATRPGEVAGSDVAVKRATAVGDVQCRLLRPGQADRGIDGDRLVLETAPGADGKRVPRSVVADGNVHAIDVKQEIFADHLDALIRPKPAPAVADKKAKQPANDEDALDLESMYASKNVHAKLKSGAMADADELRVTTTTNDKQKIELRGQPTASIGDGKGSTLSGPVLHVSPDPLLVTVDGPGTMRKMRRATTTQPAQPMDVSWTDSMTYDGTGNMIDVIGHVAVAMTDKSGTVDTMHGDTAHLELVDVKPAKPEKRAKPGAAPTTRPESDFGDKELKSMLLQGHVHGESELKDANGAPLRRGAVVGDRLTYDAEKGRTEIPGPGWLEMEDHRSTKAGGNRGAMAIQWKTGLLYNKPANQVVITGDTLVGFRKDAKDAAPMQLKAQRLTIDVQPEKAGAPADASIQISHVRAEENVDMFLPGKGTHFMGHSVDYDPAKEEVTLRGSAQEPGRVLDEQGASTGTFDELVIDTRTQEVDRTRGANLNMRK